MAAAIFLTPNSWDLPAGGGSVEITVATSASTVGNIPAPDVVVALSASSGTLSDTSPRTDRSGHAKVTWSGTSSATLTARVGEVVGTATIRVPGSTPAPTPPGPGPAPGPPPDPTPPAPGILLVEISPAPRTGDAATPITFTARVFTADGSAVGALTYAWDFETDGRIDSTEVAPTHLFAPADHWTVTLTVTAADGRKGRSQVDVPIGAAPVPTVTVSLSAAPSTALVGQTFTFTATASSNSTAGPILVYEWDFDTSTATIDRLTPDGSTSTTYATAGARTVRVTARTATTSGSATTAITVNDLPLTVGLAYTGSTTAPAALTFTATLSSAGGVPTSGVQYEWDWDNSGTVDFTQTGGASSSAGFTFNAPDTYKIKVTITAPDGRTASNTITVIVS